MSVRFPPYLWSATQTDYVMFATFDQYIHRPSRLPVHTVNHYQGIPGKGKVLTQISKFWFEKLAAIVPNHFVTDNIDEMPEEVRQYKDQLDGRAMLVKKATVIPLEAIVRGYITGAYLE